MNACGSDVSFAMSWKLIQNVALLMTKGAWDQLHHECMDEMCVHFKNIQVTYG